MRKRLLSGQKASAHEHGNARLFLHGLRNDCVLRDRAYPLDELRYILKFDNLTGRRILGLLVNLLFTGLLLISYL
jgi:hypothetical protein